MCEEARITQSHEDAFPNLVRVGYRKTSEEDAFYNCIAWSWGDESKDQWWSPFEHPGYFWPPGFTRGTDIQTFVRLYQELGGYRECQSSAIEAGLLKIALYADLDGDFTHVARQKPNGFWTSKLGSWEDIEHKSPEALEGDDYGKVYVLMAKNVEREHGS